MLLRWVWHFGNQSVTNLLTGRRPLGLVFTIGLVRGALASSRCLVDQRNRRFVPGRDEESPRPLDRLLPAPLAEQLRYRRRRWRTRRPTTFNAKVEYKMLRDRRAYLVTTTDKVAVRDYVQQQAPGCRLPELYAVVEDLRHVDTTRLPTNFVVKASHASGKVVVVSDLARRGCVLPEAATSFKPVMIHPNDLDWSALARLTDRWIDATYGQGSTWEWAYSRVPHRLLVEERLADRTGKIPTDHKLWVFNGRCELIEVTLDRFATIRELLFTRTWDQIDAWTDYPPHPDDRLVRPPSGLGSMIEIAERLGAATDFVRVDLYECAGRIVFGELTNYPGAGREPFRTTALDEQIGAMWDVPRSYRRARFADQAARRRSATMRATNLGLPST